MPPKRKPSLTPLIQPKNQSTQCDFYLKETSSKAVQINPLLRNAESQTKQQRFKNTWTQTTENRNVRETQIAGSQTDYVYTSNRTTQCDFHLKITRSIETQTNPLKRKSTHSGDQVTKRLKLCQDDSITTSALDLIYDYISKLELVCIVFQCMKSVDGTLRHLEVTRSDNLVILGNYYDTPIRMFFTMDGRLTILKPFKKAEQKEVFRSTEEQGLIISYNVIDEALKDLVENLVFCPGIPKEDCENIKTKKLEEIKYPFRRHQSVDCPVFYAAPKNLPKEQLKAQSYQHQCGKCRYLNRYILGQKKKRTEVTPRTHLKRQSVLSRCRISVLTPRSRKKRFIENRTIRFRVNKRVKELEQKLEESSLELNMDQHRKMQEVIASINTNGSAELEKVFQEASEKNHTLGIALKKSWNLDTERNGFIDVQMRCEKGSKGNRWSPLTYRIALSVFSRSPAAYEALASFDIFKLPSVYSLRNKMKNIPSKQGIDLIFLQGEAKRFDEFVEKYPGKNKPPKEGVLIFDEVKIIGKLMWNSSNNEFIGCCIDPAEYPSMDDLFKENTVSETLEAEYVLQFLWRCVSSSFDIIGPYFMLPKAASNSFLINTIYDVIWAFQCVGLETSALVCDGGTSNIAALRHTIGIEKPFTYSENQNGTFNFRFKPCFKHPFLKGRRIFWIVCPTHQLKNMINALNHSKDNDSKEFTILGDIVFGWSQIVDLYEREVDRRDNNELVQVKGLILAFIERDPWVKLNVTPAKIMQTQKVLGELFNYANPMAGDPPEDKDKVMACHDYLFACHKIFEKGLLSHEKVESLTSAPVKSMLQGLEFFESWATERILCEEDLKEKTGQKFLAWQTWELLRISIFGFCDFAEDFTSRNPTKYIYPVRINGSAVETIFSQQKYVTAGKLTSLNYRSSRRALLIKGCTKTTQNAEAEYRKVGVDLSSK